MTRRTKSGARNAPSGHCVKLSCKACSIHRCPPTLKNTSRPTSSQKVPTRVESPPVTGSATCASAMPICWPTISPAMRRALNTRFALKPIRHPNSTSAIPKRTKCTGSHALTEAEAPTTGSNTVETATTTSALTGRGALPWPRMGRNAKMHPTLTSTRTNVISSSRPITRS
ncbi:MAG: hypothetical protein AMK73_00835 [Planctomycetes bacterium SM23_32]|nr:MAG: hypothetical protein AMK73_00835 [Planctomycetes bacterium SM23_32]